MTVEIPNIRQIYIPDDEFIIIDADLMRADAQVVAWEADDPSLKKAFRENLDIHTQNAIDIYGYCDPDKRKKAKAGIHATNYGVWAKTLAATLECSTSEAQSFINGWFRKHPKIKDWHNSVEESLLLKRCVYNIWGFRRYYFDRMSNQLFNQALGFIGQSTVAIVINKGYINIDKNLPEVQILLQDHDSLLMQTHKSNCPAIFSEIQKQMQITIPYPDPLIIPVEIKYSPISWGDVIVWSEKEDAKTYAERLDQIIHGVHQ